MFFSPRWVPTSMMFLLALMGRSYSFSQSRPSRGVASTYSSSTTATTTALNMGFFDSISKAFANTEYGPPPEAVRVTARHILVPTEQEILIIMKMIAEGEQTFESCVQDFSTCPSRSKGGSLGSFSPGTMVPEFDKVVFSPDTKVGQLMGPVLTDFGFHAIVVDKRSGGGDKY